MSSQKRTIACVTCFKSAEILQSLPLGWSTDRFDSKGEPVIWPYVDDEETPRSRFGRCRECVESNKRMPLGIIPRWAERLIERYQKDIDPGSSRERAFAKIWEAVRDQSPLNQMVSNG